MKRARYVELFLILAILPAVVPVYLYILNAYVPRDSLGPGLLTPVLYDIPIINNISYVWALLLGLPYILWRCRRGFSKLWMVLIPGLILAGSSLVAACVVSLEAHPYTIIVAVCVAPGVVLAGICWYLLAGHVCKSTGVHWIIFLTIFIWVLYFSYVTVQYHRWYYRSAQVPIPPGGTPSAFMTLVSSWFTWSLAIAGLLSCVWVLFTGLLHCGHTGDSHKLK